MAPQASSTLNLYASKSLRLGVILEISIHSKPTIPQSADFLTYFLQERNLSFKSTEGYRNAISRPIKLVTSLDVCQDPLLPKQR